MSDHYETPHPDADACAHAGVGKACRPCREVLDNLHRISLRHTRAGRALMAEAWDDGYITGESDGWRNRDDPGSLVEEGGSHNPYREETPNE